MPADLNILYYVNEPVNTSLHPGYEREMLPPLLYEPLYSNAVAFIDYKNIQEKRIALLEKKIEVAEAIQEQQDAHNTGELPVQSGTNQENAHNTSELPVQRGVNKKSTNDYINDLHSDYNPFDDIGTD